MNLRPLTEGEVSSTGTVTLNGRVNGQGGRLGAVLISTDGSSVGTFVVRENDASGDILFDLKSATAQMVFAPVSTSTQTLYYSFTGTGASAMLYEWID